MDDTSDATFLPDEETQEIRAIGHDLRERIAKLEVQMMAQYTAMAAYATIAQNNVDAVKAESRHDVDRTQSTLIGLVERVRQESLEAAKQRGPNGGALPPPVIDEPRLVSIEQRFEALASALERSIEMQRALAEQVAVLVEEKMQREGWLVTNGSVDDLSLR
ncbi:MAG: hypothetical protein WD023_11140 [Ilumatobacteraceae bacterium]